jgi:hypothetical protein
MSAAVSKTIDAWAFRSQPKRSRAPASTTEPPRPTSEGSESESTHQRQSHSSRGEVNTGQGTILSPGMLHRILIQGYLKPGDGDEVPPLQIRRTLDHYFYSNLDSTSRRDNDQVIQRYTANFVDVDPKMFMVDQLWLWVLDDGKRA